MPPEMIFRAMIGFRIVTTDPARLAVFYRAIGFDVGETAPIPTSEMELLGLRGAGSRMTMSLGPSRVDLEGFSTIRVAYTPAVLPPATLCSNTSRSSRRMRRAHGVGDATLAPRGLAERAR